MVFSKNKEKGIAHILLLVVILGLLALTVYLFASGSLKNLLGNLKINEKNVFAQEITHPFLIVKQEDFQSLRDKSISEPWKSMKTKAATDAAKLNYDSSLSVQNKANRMRDTVSAASLSYILEPDASASATYKDKVRDTLMNWDDLYTGLDCSLWSTTVPPGYAFFNSVLAFDIIYNDLTPEEKSSIESKLDNIAEWYWSNNCAWPTNQNAVRGVWALFQGDRSRFDTAKANYRSSNESYLTSNGVFNMGTNYAWSRLGSDTNDAKSYFIDVLEFTGEDSYYTDPKFIQFNEWLFSGSITPFRETVTFGDSDPDFLSLSKFPMAAVNRAFKFSDQAAKNAAWLAEGATHKGRLLHYLLLEQPLASPEKPISRIWKDGMVSFWENNPVTTSLMGALWNPKSFTDHAHKDVNAIHLSAYGENILRNSGYEGWKVACGGDTWTYVHDTAVSSNTLLIDGKDHFTKNGAGVIEGFTGGLLDYASGDSGPAIKEGTHLRNFIFVHPQDSKPGYFILADEVVAKSKNAKVNIALHPNSANYSTILTNQEYIWTINQYTGQNVYTSIFLGTSPTGVEIRNGALCTKNTTFPSFSGKYIYSTYPTNKGKKNIVTIIFPSDATHPKADMTRVSGSGYSGAKVDFGGGVVDTALESAGISNVTYGGAIFRGLASVYRTNGNNFYFVRRGRTFNNGQTPRIGFDSNSDISIYIKDKLGNIVSPGTDVTIYYPNIVNVKLNSNTLTNISSGTGWVKVNIPSGTHSLEII